MSKYRVIIKVTDYLIHEVDALTSEGAILKVLFDSEADEKEVLQVRELNEVVGSKNETLYV